MTTENSRRKFLKFTGFLTVSTVGTVLAGCGGGHDQGFFPSGALPGLPTSPVPVPGDPEYQPRAAGTYAFPNGIASGDPKSDSVVFWTRIETAQEPMGTQDLNIVLQVASKPFDDPSFSSSDILVGHPIVIQARFNYTVHHRVEGLESGRHYWYRFRMDNDTSVQGRTKTAPAADSTNPIQFAYVSCQDWSANHWDSFRILGQAQFDELDFIVHLGDYIYETADDSYQTNDAEPLHRNSAVDPTRLSGQKKTGGTHYASTLNDYRYLYAKYRSDSRIQAIHAKFPMIAIWDDHEFSNDCWTDHETYSNDEDVQTGRRRDANQAWFENMPVTMEDVSFSPDSVNYDNIRIYREFSFGKVMQLIMTDERLYRSDHAVPEKMGASAIEGYISKIINNAGNISDPNGLYSFIKNARIFFLFSAEALLDDVINQGFLASFVKMPGIDFSTIKPTIIKFLNGALPTPLAENSTLNTKFILETLATIDSKVLIEKLAGFLGFGGGSLPLGSRYAALGNILSTYVAQNSSSQYSMLGMEQTTWWKARMAAAQASGTVWKIWGNEVCFLKMPLDINRIRNQGLVLPGILGSVLGSLIAGLLAVLKYVLTMDAVRATPLNMADYSSDGGANSKPGQQIIPFADCWDGYPTARDELTSFLAKNSVDNVIAITGDLHTFIAGQVQDPSSKTPVMLDFVGAGISSASFGGMAASFLGKSDSTSTTSLLDGLKPLLTSRDVDTPNTSMLNSFVTGIASRPDKVNNGRDLLARLLIHFSDEVQWAEGLANGFASVVLDTQTAKVTYHNVRVERDAAHLVMAPDTYTTDSDPNSAYERRSSFTVRAKNAVGSPADANVAIWPAFPPRVQEYENPAVAQAPAPAPVLGKPGMPSARPPVVPEIAPTASDIANQLAEKEKMRAGAQAFVEQNPSNPFARVFLEAIQQH